MFMIPKIHRETYIFSPCKKISFINIQEFLAYRNHNWHVPLNEGGTVAIMDVVKIKCFLRSARPNADDMYPCGFVCVVKIMFS